MTYDLIVIGAGQAGPPLAYAFADAGRRVALIEAHYLGGTCVNYGCTPTKTMMASARVAHTARRATRYGVHVGDVKVNLEAVVARKNQIVLSFRSGQADRIEQNENIDLYRGRGKFTGPKTVEVDGGTLTAETICINVGTRPRMPAIPGLGEVDALTNRTMLDLTEQPDHLIVVGSGPIGLEFAQMMRRFGSRVTVLERSGQIAKREDPEVAETLQQALTDDGIQFELNTSVTSVAKTKYGVLASVERDGAPAQIAGSHLLVATGRVPNTETLGLDVAGIEMDERGYIRTNDRLETNIAGVYAVGDVRGEAAFTHISCNDHLVVLNNTLHVHTDNGQRNKPGSIASRLVPYAIYTDPELGRVGLTEAEAREQGYEVKVGKQAMSAVGRAIERGETAGLMKLVVDAKTDLVLGATILGTNGGETVQLFTLLMAAGLPYTTIGSHFVFIHPTLMEGLFGLIASIE